MTLKRVSSFLILVSLISPLSTFAKVEVTDGSVKAIYHLEDTADASGNGYNLTNNNSVGFSSGILSNAACTGSGNTNKYLFTSETMGIDASPSTFSFWLKYADVPGSYKINFSQFNSAGNRVFNLSQYTGSQMEWDYNRAGINDTRLQYTTSPGTSNWHHIVYRYDGALLEGFYDGVSRGTVSASGNGSGPSTSGLALFGLTPGSDVISGCIDEFDVFNVAISTSTIAALYNSGNGAELCNTVGCATVSPTSTDSAAKTGTLSVLYMLLVSLTFGVGAFTSFKFIS